MSQGGRTDPLLLLDVDGVLNPFAADTCPPGYREHAFFPDEDPPVRLCDEHGRWLDRLGRDFELVWATGWEDEANTLLAPALNLPTLPVLRFPPVPFEPSAKVPAIDTFAGDRPAAWVDDAHTPEAWTWAHGRTAPTLLVPTNPALGLTSRIVDNLLAWRASLQTRCSGHGPRGAEQGGEGVGGGGEDDFGGVALAEVEGVGAVGGGGDVDAVVACALTERGFLPREFGHGVNSPRRPGSVC